MPGAGPSARPPNNHPARSTALAQPGARRFRHSLRISSDFPLCGCCCGELFESGDDAYHLPPSFFQRARAVNLVVGHAAFLIELHLRADSAEGLLPRHPAGQQALHLLLRLTPGDHQAVETLVVAGFDQQRRLHDHHRARLSARQLGELAIQGVHDAGMDDAVQAFEPGGVGEDDRGELGAVNAAVGGAHLATKLFEDLVVSGLAGLNQAARERVGIEYAAAELAHHCGHGALAAGNPSGEADVQHQRLATFSAAVRATGRDAPPARLVAFPLRRRAALTVLLISMAMVSGPTPPGTGVIAPATPATSGWTSPTRVEPLMRNCSRRSGKLANRRSASAVSVTRLMPTSTTVAPGRIQSGATIAARPIAATTISPRRVTSRRWRVFE